MNITEHVSSRHVLVPMPEVVVQGVQSSNLSNEERGFRPEPKVPNLIPKPVIPPTMPPAVGGRVANFQFPCNPSKDWAVMKMVNRVFAVNMVTMGGGEDEEIGIIEPTEATVNGTFLTIPPLKAPVSEPGIKHHAEGSNAITFFIL